MAKIQKGSIVKRVTVIQVADSNETLLDGTPVSHKGEKTQQLMIFTPEEEEAKKIPWYQRQPKSVQEVEAEEEEAKRKH